MENEQLSNYINAIANTERRKRFADSPQLTLGQLIRKIEECGVEDKNSEPKNIYYDFGGMTPTILDSWRGSYSELALGFDRESSEMRADKILKELKSAIGKTYQGWKGGDFTMNEDTPVWVDNCGESTETAIIGVLDEGWRLIILTAYMEY